MNKIAKVRDKNILLLQGPMGNFFRRVDRQLKRLGAKTFRIGLNAGDRLFSDSGNYTPFRGKKETWSSFLSRFAEENDIDIVFIFGDCRFYQSVAINVFLKMDIDIFVFEEGYIRPNFITLERYGVNDFSRLPRERDFYEKLSLSDDDQTDAIVNADTKFYRMGLSAAAYYIAKTLFWFCYPYYIHHRQYNLFSEAFFALRSVTRKFKYMISEKKLRTLLPAIKHRYYFVPLQTYSDFQVSRHSSFSSVESFIETIIYSFAQNAPKNTLLIIKHHPMDRGRRDYRPLIEQISNSLNLQGRVIAAYDLHIPTCLKNAIGTITINSTVGLSSLYHDTPTIVLGNAVYNIDGLTCRDLQLDNFWTHYRKPDRELFGKFRKYLIANTQLNGSFYGKFPDILKLIQ